MEKELEVALERYDRMLGLYLAAQGELGEAAQELRRRGVHKSSPKSLRFPLPDEREGTTHKIEIGAPPKKFEGYATTGVYSDGRVGEIFLEAEKEGTFISGIIDAFAVMFSLALQYGVPLEHIVDKLKNSRFEPDGFTKNPAIQSTTSVVDYLMKWLELNYNKEKIDDRSTG
jgi:ribonucleoside-diphosphate reductase alpha chain